MRTRLAALAAVCAACATAAPLVFPAPRHIEIRDEQFRLDEAVPILLPERPSPGELFLARALTIELSDRYGLALRTRTTSVLPAGGPFILMGTCGGALVSQYCRKHGAPPPKREGYLLDVSRDGAVVAGGDEAGAFYAFQSLRQLIRRTPRGVSIGGALIRDWPEKPFRGVKMYLPGRENIPFFKRFVRDVMAQYKYNTLILEVNASMRLDRHPELNTGWIELGRNLTATRRERAWGPGHQFQDSANADAADGGVLEREEVADLVSFARRNHIEVIPEIPSLTHSYYLLTRHRELAEVPAAEWPDTYCPSEPAVYRLLFDVIDEYIDVMRPSMVHIGHDEWRTPVGVCPRCKGKDPRELFAADLNRIYAHLREKGIGTAIWGDHLMERVRGKKIRHVANPGGTPYDVPGGLSPEQVRKLIPKDILVFNWFWDERQNEDLKDALGEANEAALSEWGFRQVFGNFEPHMSEYDRRAARAGILGGAPSSWAATNELNFGKDLLLDVLGCANLLWSSDRPDMMRLALTVQERLPEIRNRLRPKPLPSDSAEAAPVSFAQDRPARIGADVSSIIFLHACRKRGRNEPAYTATWNYADTAELVGWYEVQYEDGLVESVPLRYGVNILEESWLRAPQSVAYEARIVPQGDGAALFAYEWVNPRFGKIIREVRLRSASDENPVRLAGVSIVRASK